MTNHTPSTTDIRIRYERYREQEHQRGADGVTPVTPGEFERWLNDLKAEVWDEGFDAGWDEREDFVMCGGFPSGKHQSEVTNPYRTERTTDEH